MAKMCLYPDIKTVLMADIGIRNYTNFIHVYTLSHLKEKKKEENSGNEKNKIKKQVLPYSFLLLFAFPQTPRLVLSPGGFLWVRQLYREHRRERADELSIQPGDRDDTRWFYDVCSCWISHDDPALPPGHQHYAF